MTLQRFQSGHSIMNVVPLGIEREGLFQAGLRLAEFPSVQVRDGEVIEIFSRLGAPRTLGKPLLANTQVDSCPFNDVRLFRKLLDHLLKGLSGPRKVMRAEAF